MKTLAFVEYFPPKLGSDRRIYEIMKRLSGEHEIHFIVVPPFRMLAGKLSLREGNFQLHFRKKESVAIQNGIVGHFIPFPRLFLRLWSLSYGIAYPLTLVWLFLKVFRSVVGINPEVIVLNYPSVYTGVLGFFAGKLLRKFVVVDFNDLIAQYTVNLLGLKKDSFTARMLVLAQNFIVKKSDKVVATTSFIKNYSLDLTKNSRGIVVIPNGVDTELFNPDNYKRAHVKSKLHLGDKKTCLYCGRLDEWAGIKTVAELCRIFEEKRSDVKFVIVGAGAKANTLSKDVTTTGEVPYQDVPRLLMAADIILVPFPSNEVSHAASPLKLFEAMAMQKPIVASRVRGIEEVVADNESGMLVDPDNLDEWYEAVSALLNSESFARKLGENARRVAKEKYDWNRLSRQYEKMLINVDYK